MIPIGNDGIMPPLNEVIVIAVGDGRKPDQADIYG